MRSLRAHLRSYAIALALVFCLTLAFVTVTSHNTVSMIFWGAFTLATSGFLIGLFRKEKTIAEDHLTARSTVTSVSSGRRGGLTITYVFIALNGKEYGGSSDWWGKKVQVGSELPVMYKTLKPELNLPSMQFLFYSFRAARG